MATDSYYLSYDMFLETMLDTFALKENARELMATYIRSHSVAVWQGSKTQDHEYIGSAACIEIDSRLFIATAAHNFKVVREGGTVTFFSTSSDIPLKPIDHNYGAYGASDTLDLAWIEIDSSSAIQTNLQGVSMDSVEPYHRQRLDGVYQISGFPAGLAWHRTINNHTDIAVPLVIYNTIPGKHADPSADDLLLDYGKSGMSQHGLTDMPEPEGISGGGIWYVPFIDESQIWTPTKHPLVGIATHFLPVRRQIRGVPIHHWLKLVASDHPELRKHIDAAL